MNRKNRFGLWGGPSSFSPLSDDFIFGVASSDHQCEAYKQGWDDIRDHWERLAGKVKRENATEFWDRYSEDIDRAKALGCQAFRFSVSWSRVDADINNSLDHYEDLVNEIKKGVNINGQKMEPVLTLHHFVWPPKVDMISPDFPEKFCKYVTKVVDRLGDKVKYWVPINEPNNLIWGYIKPFWDNQHSAPPGKIHPNIRGASSQIDAVGELIPNLFLAYAKAYDVIKGKNPNAEVGTNPWVAGFPPWLQWRIDSNAERMGSQMKTLSDWTNQNSMLIDHKPFDHGRSDIVLATFSQTPDREQKVNFSSEIYFETEQRLLVRADSKAITVKDLFGKKIAVVKGSTAESSVRKMLRRYRIPVSAKSEKKSKDAMSLLEDGHTDAFLSDLSIIHGLIKDNPSQYRIIEEPLEAEYGEPLEKEHYAVAVTQGKGMLLDLVDQAIWRFKDSGEWKKSYAQHIDSRDVPEPPISVHRTQDFKDLAMQDGLSPLEMKDPSLQRIWKKGVLRVAVKSDASSLSREVNRGEFQGLEIDLARAIGRRIFGDPEKVKFHAVDTKDRLSQLITRKGFMDSLIKMYCVVSTVFAYSNWWYLGFAGKLPSFICPIKYLYTDSKDSHWPKMDFIGLDYYYGIRSLRPDLIIGLMNAGKKGDFDKAPIWPEALYDHLSNLSKLINDPKVLKDRRDPLPLYILENGWVDVRDGPMDRAAYIQRHVQQVQRAQMAGLKVKMYLYWSLTTNNEWGLPIGRSTDFGLFKINLNLGPDAIGYQERTPSPVCKLYRDIINSQGVLQK
jgi:beta-glucosidase/6-phospho-beta-glucosidase/beta-galactosidase/ABC-type amino acid transport substrate-binding protein